MTPSLSPRALQFVNNSLRRRVPIGQDEAAQALTAARSPLFPAWLHFLTHYGGMKYCLDNSNRLTQNLYDACFTPEEDGLPLDLDGAILFEEAGPPLLDLGYYRAAGPCGIGLDAAGTLLWDYQVPVFSTIEKLLESDAVLYEISRRSGEWWSLRGEASGRALPEFSRQASLQRIEAAEDRWNHWWAGEEIYVQHFAAWTTSERPSYLWIFCSAPSLEATQASFASCFVDTPSLTRRP